MYQRLLKIVAGLTVSACILLFVSKDALLRRTADRRIAAVEAYGARVGDTRLRVRCLRCGAEREMLWSALFSGTLRRCLHCGARGM